jgi:chorismate mutase/prephenate dehydratase
MDTMSKKPSAKGTTPNELRRQIEKADRELAKLVASRTELAVKFHRARVAEGRPLFDAVEEQELLHHAIDGVKGTLAEHSLRAVWQILSSGARSAIKATRVAYLGPQYSYSHIAAIEHFGTQMELAPVASIKSVFEELVHNTATYGVVPIENSTDGRIVDTLDMFARNPVRICGEVQLKIHHQLLGRCTRAEITEVYSKPQALSQCREWLGKHVPQARLVEMTSTTAAAQLAAEKPGAAAVASLQAAEAYGLNVIDTNIEDNRHNATRFAVLGGQEPKRTGKDKTAIMFEAPHRPGSLADAMGVFKRNRLNMTWIESFPIIGARNQYLFFVEFEGHQSESRVKKALEQLKPRTIRLETLGSYPKAEPVE